MQDYIRTVAKRRNEETGASAVEYGLLVALIAAVIVVAVFALGGFVKGAFESTCDAVATGSQAGGNTSSDCGGDTDADA
jgi:pilus assembly protein Flp/PilA